MVVSRLQSWQTPAHVEGGNYKFETRVGVLIGTWRKRANIHGFGCCWSKLVRGVSGQKNQGMENIYNLDFFFNEIIIIFLNEIII